MKFSDALCEINERIDSEEECKSAVRYLNDHGDNLTFSGNESDPDFPKGCYVTAWPNLMWRNVFWNGHSLGAADSDSKPICKQGEYIELITIHLLIYDTKIKEIYK